MPDKLHLTSVEDTAPMIDSNGEVVDAYFLLRASDSDGGEHAYRLRAVAEGSPYLRLYSEEIIGGEVPDPQEGLPLVVPAHTVAAEGLVGHIMSRYLDPGHPEEINRIEPLLVGPLDGENYTTYPEAA